MVLKYIFTNANIFFTFFSLPTWFSPNIIKFWRINVFHLKSTLSQIHPGMISRNYIWKHEKSPSPHVCVNQIWMVLLANMLYTLLDSFGLILHYKNLFGGIPLRWTWYFQQSLHNVACKLYENWYFLELFVLCRSA